MSRQLLAWVRRTRPALLELTCAEHPDPVHGAPDADVVQLTGCLADIAPHLPLECVVSGAGRVILRLDGCARPEEARRRHAPSAAATTALGTGSVELARSAARVHRRAVLDARHLPLTRRALFLLETSPVQPEETTPHRRFAAALSALAADRVELLIDGPGLALAVDGCSASGVCVRSCPERALTLVPSDGATELRFDPGRCSGCGRCITLCGKGALSARGAVPLATILRSAPEVLARMRTVRCTRCGADFRPDRGDERLCPVCTFRVAHPFGSVRPRALD